MQADFSLDYDVLTVERPQKLYLMARLESGPAPNEGKRRPLNLGLVIDRSGSMAGAKIDYTRQAAQFLVQNLGAMDILSIVLYNDKIQTLLPPEYVQRKDAINQMIDTIKVSGTTNLSGGWLEGCNHIAANQSDGYLNRVILMSDGLANRGVTNTEKLVKMVSGKLGDGISTTTMGLGQDFNEDLMMSMADAGGGAFYFIESPEAAPVIFEEELQGLLSVVGQNLIISLEPTQHVTGVKQMNAYSEQRNGQTVSFRLGDVFGDEVKTLIMELSIPGLSEIGHMQIATLRFDYDELLPDGSSEHRVWELPVIVNVQQSLGEQPKLADPGVAEAVLLLKAAQARKRAVQAADKGDYDTAAKILREMAEQLAPMKSQERIKEEHDALIQQAEEMDRGAERYDRYSRKTMVTQSMYTMTSRHDETMVLRMRESKRQIQRDPPQPPTDAEAEKLPQKQPGVTPTHVTWQGQTFELTGDLIRIGRSSHNEIKIGVEGVSRFHCHIKRQDGKLILEDLESTNGTAVGGQFLTGPYTLSVGDVVFVCDEKLIFHDDTQAV